MLQSFVNKATAIFGWIHKSRRIKPKQDIVKVNVGSGLSVAPGWINLDSSILAVFSKMPAFFLKKIYSFSGNKTSFTPEEFISILHNNLFYQHNAAYGMPFSDESIDFIFSSHLLEHLYKDDAHFLLKDMYRVLKKGGLVRINVPDLEYAINLYKKGDYGRASNYFFTPNYVNRFNRHRFMYDFSLLKSFLEEAGFTNVERCQYQKGEMPDIKYLDRSPKETLFVEAHK